MGDIGYVVLWKVDSVVSEEDKQIKQAVNSPEVNDSHYRRG